MHASFFLQAHICEHAVRVLMEMHEVLVIQCELSAADFPKRRMCTKNVQQWTQRMKCGSS